ncbi:MAG: PaaI family thioesterase [Rhodospirillaceae bacterium]|nr:PaaI family thioesterase [Rhodospirillaceae bacterium]
MNAPAFAPLNPDYAARVRDSFARQPFMEHLGARMTAVAPGFVEIEVAARRELTQQHGFVHGGVLASIADSAAGYAAFSLMPAEATVLTVEYKLNIVRPGRGEAMVARGRVVKPGRSLFVVQADVFARSGRSEEMVVTSLQTLMRLDGRADDASGAPGSSR